MTKPNTVELLRSFVAAHGVPHPTLGRREPILYIRHGAGADLQHHALADPALQTDEAALEEMHDQGLIDIDYREHSWHVTPTQLGRQVAESYERVTNSTPVAAVEPLVEAVEQQAAYTNKLAWPAVRPVLAELRAYWEAGGYSPHGIQLGALVEAIPEEHLGLFVATVSLLIEGDYLQAPGAGLTIEPGGLPGEVRLTPRASEILDGWPGAAPSDLVENLLAILAERAEAEPDPEKKRRLQKVGETVRELGVATAGEVLAKVLLGGT